MLSELKKHPNSIIQPFVDGIDAGNIEYTAPGEIYTGSFSWDLRYRCGEHRVHSPRGDLHRIIQLGPQV